jgi:hypothetical protein
MHILAKLAIALPLLLPIPGVAQDFLGQFEDFVETLTDPPPRRPRPAEPDVGGPSVAPVPRPRPPGLPDSPEVRAPITPATPDIERAPEPLAPEEEPAAVEPEAPVNAEAEPESEPETEPERIYQAACPAVLQGLVVAEMAPPLSEGSCGEQSPLLVSAVMSRGRLVPLSAPITTNCQMASALPDWVADVDGFAEAMLGSRLAEVTTGTSYMCRNRNNGADGLTSEHGFANAVDVTGFVLEDGRSIGVEGDWLPANEPEGRLLRLAHDAACGGFTTVLGPEANQEHEDHLHLDLGCHGASCTARVCE